jgi:hypothetical protein
MLFMSQVSIPTYDGLQSIWLAMISVDTLHECAWHPLKLIKHQEIESVVLAVAPARLDSEPYRVADRALVQ